jgi:hypothetical protein
MQPVVNRQLFTQKVFDSGSLGVLVSVIHRFEQPGRYDGTVLRGDTASSTFSFVVDEASSNQQLNIDLAASEEARETGDCCGKKGEPQVVSPKGYVIFYVSRGSGYSVRVGRGDDKEPAFDSRKLEKGDLFAMSLLEPTKYSMADQIGGAKGEINVGFSPEIAKRLRSLEPVYVEAAGKAFEPARVDLASMQGLVFRIQKASRIVVEKQSGAPAEGRAAFEWRSARRRQK